MNELKVVQELGRISFNFDELRTEIQALADEYTNVVYTDAVISEAKEDRAKLNKLKTALNDERKRREKEFMTPFNEFKANVNDLIAIIDKPIAMIDEQVKGYEAQKKQLKADEIRACFDNIEKPEFLRLEQIWNEKWLNASVSMKSVGAEIEATIKRIETEIVTLASLEFAFEATEVYKQTLDITKALTEGQRLLDLQKRKEEAQRVDNTPVTHTEAHTAVEREQAEDFIPCFEDVTDLLIQCPKSKLQFVVNFLENEGCIVKEVAE